MLYDVALLPGDGIGPEVIEQARRVLDAVGRHFGHQFRFFTAEVGGAALDRYGRPLPDGLIERCRATHGVLFGAVGGPKWDDGPQRPEDGLLALRKGLGLYANLRPVVSYKEVSVSPVKDTQNIDILFIRELTGGLYYGQPKRRWESRRIRHAVDTLEYSEREIERVVRLAFEMARRRRRLVTCVDKANVLVSSRLWREIAQEIAVEYPDVRLEFLLVDRFAMDLILRPRDFDVVVTENLMGDILTDEAAVLVGGLGMMPSASLGARRRGRAPKGSLRAFGLYEPVHGSAPDLAGRDRANPIGAILSAALLLRHSCGLEREAEAVEMAVREALRAGYRTADIAAPGNRIVGTVAMGNAIIQALESVADRVWHSASRAVARRGRLVSL